MASAAAAAITVNILLTCSTTKFISPYHPYTNRIHLTFFTRCYCSTKPDTFLNPTVHSNSTPSSSSRGLVFDLGSNSSWDCHEVGSPVVKRFISDEEERWYMWYHGSRTSSDDPPSDSIGLALSNNGVHWERGTGPVRSNAEAGSVMSPSKDWWAFDTASIRPSEVVIMSSNKVRASTSVYWLYYTGFNSEKLEFEFQGGKVSSVLMSLPGLAISQDGRHWARIEGEHHSGALFDVGAETEWDSLFIAAPQVFFHCSGDLRMYYHSFDVKSGQFCIGIARSRDGIKWLKLGKILGGGSVASFDELGVKNANVVKNHKDGSYVMAYEGVGQDGNTSIGLAVSRDGLKNWRKCEEGAILKLCMAKDGWDNMGVGEPCLVQMDGKDGEWRLYYRGVGVVGKTGIGMAVSAGKEMSNFTRWEGFHV